MEEIYCLKINGKECFCLFCLPQGLAARAFLFVNSDITKGKYWKHSQTCLRPNGDKFRNTLKTITLN